MLEFRIEMPSSVAFRITLLRQNLKRDFSEAGRSAGPMGSPRFTSSTEVTVAQSHGGYWGYRVKPCCLCSQHFCPQSHLCNLLISESLAAVCRVSGSSFLLLSRFFQTVTF